MSDCHARWATLLLLVAVVGCAREAHGSAPDAGSGRARGAPTEARDASPTEPSSLVGLTRAQLRARRGPPLQDRGAEWVYTPDQPGCREVIVSEVVAFKGDKVASVRLERTRTHKICRQR
jgi:hypothetical protein